ncbi:MAG: insulinase family protein [Planctomycetales bacterium]|nr:insulinase family protein [Planctomycetales bacterium]
MELLTYKTDKCPEIVVLNDPEAFTLSVGWFVRTGARDESNEVAGVSHFLEHMVFKGTPRRSAEDVNRELDHLGAQSNAYTSEDSTVFYASVLPECQTQAVDLLTDLMQPLLNEEDFETERQVILEEIAMYDDQPPYGAFERAMELFFGSHPLATRVLGSTESVSDLSVQQMREYHSLRYSVDNMFLCASGKVDFARLIEDVERLTVDWPSLVTPPRKLSVPGFGQVEEEIERESTYQHYAIQLWPGLSVNDARRYALRLLCSALADDSGSRLFWELIDTGKAETASLWPQMFEECGCLIGYLCCAPEDAAENQAVWERVIETALKEGVTQKELDLARNKITASLILSDERPSNRMFALGQSWLNRRAYEPLDVVLSRYMAVTLDDLREVADQTLSGSPTSVRVIGQVEPS